VAANARYAIEEIAHQFQDSTGIATRCVVASSGKLSAQIRSGAPFDVFLSADTTYPAELIQDGFAIAPLHLYAKGELILWSTTAGSSEQLREQFKDPAARIALANPRTAPYGRAAEDIMNAAFTSKSNSPKRIYGSSISQVNQYVFSGAVDAGFTAKSTLYSLAPKAAGYWIDFPKGSYSPIVQGAVLVHRKKRASLAYAQQFLTYLSSSEARGILQKYGYHFE